MVAQLFKFFTKNINFFYNFFTDFARDLIFGEINQSRINISKQETKEYLCCVCKQNFEERYQLTDHIGKKILKFFLIFMGKKDFYLVS